MQANEWQIWLIKTDGAAVLNSTWFGLRPGVLDCQARLALFGGAYYLLLQAV